MINWMSGHRAALLTLGVAASCLFLNGCTKTGGSGGGGGGGGGSAAVSLSETSLSFGKQAPNTTSTPLSVTLTNIGSAALSITGITITGTNSSDFAETNTCGSGINANANCTISVTFTPSANGARSASVNITDNAEGSPHKVQLTGTGAAGTPTASLAPTGLAFASQTVGSSSAAQTVTLSNAGTAQLSITSIAIGGADSGDFSQTHTCGSTLDPALFCDITVTFKPTALGTRTATLTVTDNANPVTQTASLTGTGTSANTIANVAPSTLSLDFGNVTVNTISAAQTVTVTNGGTTTFTVNTVTTAAPFVVSGFSPALPATLMPTQSFSFLVTFKPTTMGASNGNVTIAYDVTSGLASSILTLSGIGVSGGGGAPTACGGGGPLTITTLALPQATAGANYIAFLGASGGTAPCTWSVTTGSLPAALTLDPASGIIFGTAPSATGKSADFTVQVKDSAAVAATASETLNIKTDAATGAQCQDVYIDTSTGENAPSTPVPLTIAGILKGPHVLPLNDLGTKGGTYNLKAGGLYPGGSNVRPAAYEAIGVSKANSITALNSSGSPDPNGKYVLVTIGVSNGRIESDQFISDAGDDVAVNHSQLVIVNGAENGQDLTHITDPATNYWSDVKTKLTNAGVTANQVVAAWVKEAEAGEAGGTPNFPADANFLASKYEQVAQLLLTNFPNIKLAYYSSRIYAGYAGTVHLLNPEYVAYESGFGVKMAVEDSINAKVANAPWYDWGPYLWANGMIARSDGLVWTCQNLNSDGTHPSTTPVGGVPPPDPGAEKVAQLLLKFFKSDTTTKGWFCATGACP
jgi:Putative Ig domain/Abnormal spindle-like microcephaly-assoc'd, ASPM-SPD-2-Hydin